MGVVGLCFHRHLHTRPRLDWGVRPNWGSCGRVNHPRAREPDVESLPAIKISVVGMIEVRVNIVAENGAAPVR